MSHIVSIPERLRWPYREDLAFSFLSILVLAAPLAFSLKTYENFETIKFCLFLFLLGCALVAFAVKARQEGQVQIRLPKPVLYLLGIFVLFGVLSTFFSPGIFGNFFGLYTRFTNGFLFYFNFAALIVLLAAMLDRARYEFLLKLVIFDALLIAVYGLLQSAGIGLYSGINAGSVERSPSFLGNPNFSSFFLAAALPLVLAFLVKSESFKGKAYYALAGFFMLWGIVVFASRGGLLAAFIGLLALMCLLLLHARLRKYVFLILLAALLSGFLLNTFTPLNRPQAISETLQLKDQNINLRLYAWDIAFEAIAEKPFLGAGLGNFLEYYELHRGKHLADQADAFDDPHNLFLFQAATGGLVFALSFLGLLFLAAWNFVKKYLLTSDVVFASLAAALFVWMAAASFTPVPIPVFLLLAIILAGQAVDSGPPFAIKVSRAFGVGLKILGAAFAVFALAFLTSEHVFFRGYEAYYRQDYAKAEKFSRLAQSICPCNSLYRLYNLGSNIKLNKDSPEVLADLESFDRVPGIRPALKASNLYFLLYLETKNPVYADRATEKLLEILSANPYNAGRLARAGYYFYFSGEPQKSMLYINAALSLNPDLFPAWMLKARLHQALGEKTAMLNSLERVLKNFPEDEYLKRLVLAAKQAKDISVLPIAFGANFDRLE